MQEILRTNDAVLLSFVEALLADARIEYLVLDTHTAAIEGSILAIPRRVVVDADDSVRALALVDAAQQ